MNKLSALLVIMACLSSCSIQGKYYMIDTTTDLTMPLSVELCTKDSGVVTISDTESYDFTYKKQKIGTVFNIRIEYEHQSPVNIGTQGVCVQNMLIINDKDGNSITCFKVKPLKMQSIRIPKRELSPICHGLKEYNDSNQDHPKSIRILYSHNYCPWEGLKNYSITIEEFLQIADASIYLTDEESLKYFKGLQRRSESNEEDVPYYNFDTWFSAIVDYGTYKDTVSVSKYLLQYNDRSLKDTSAVFYK